jgi:hypothetical protein
MATAVASPTRRRGAPASWSGRARALAPHLLAVALIFAVSLAASWTWLRDGGLFLDDHWIRADAVYGEGRVPRGFFGSLGDIWEIGGYRPLLAIISAVVTRIMAGDPETNVMLTFLLGISAPLAMYAALLVTRIGWLAATAGALLFTALPIAAASRFWLAASYINLAVAFMLVGAILGVIAFRRTSGRRWAWHAASVLMLVAGALTYEVAATLVVMTIPYYVAALRRFGRDLVVRGAVDFVAVAVALAVFRMGTRTESLPGDRLVDHAEMIFREAWLLLRDGLWPDGAWGTAALVVVGGLVIALVLRLVEQRSAVLSDLRASVGEVRLWALWALGGVAAAVASYLSFVPAYEWYHPLQEGPGDRTNTVAAVGYALVYLAVAMTLATLLVAGLRRARVVKPVIVGVLVALAAIPFARELHSESIGYVEATKQSDRLIAAIKRTVPVGVQDKTFLSFGAPGFVGPQLSAFGESWDLDGAIRMALKTGTVEGYPILEGQEVVCGPTGVELPLNTQRAPNYGPNYTRPYGRVVFLDAFAGKTAAPRNAAECRRMLPSFTPGPYFMPGIEPIT